MRGGSCFLWGEGWEGDEDGEEGGEWSVIEDWVVGVEVVEEEVWRTTPWGFLMRLVVGGRRKSSWNGRGWMREGR